MSNLAEDFVEFRKRFEKEHPNETPQQVVEKMVKNGQIPLPLYRTLKTMANTLTGMNM